MKKLIVSLSLLMLMSTNIGYAYHENDRSNRTPPQRHPVHHRADRDRDERSHNQESHQKPAQDTVDRERGDNPNRQSQRQEPVRHKIVKDERVHHPNDRSKVMSASMSAHKPVTPAPTFANSPGSNEGSIAQSSNNNSGSISRPISTPHLFTRATLIE